jgi:peptidyl-prolyl cis-trans isomerase D
VSTNEVRENILSERVTREIEYVRIGFKAYEAQAGTVTDADAKEVLARADSEEAIKKYYQKHRRTKYQVPKKVKARHILSRIDPEAPPDLKKEAQEKIKKAREVVLGGMDFAEAASKFSDDSTKDKGGDLGYFSRGQMVGPFEEAAFGMKPGDVSEIIETRFGYHVIKVEDVQEAVEKKLEDVKEEIALELAKEERAKKLAEVRAKELQASISGGKTLEDVVKEENEKKVDLEPLVADTSGSFNQVSPKVGKLGIDKELHSIIWGKLSVEKPYPEAPAEVDGAWIAYKLKNHVEPSKEDYQNQVSIIGRQLQQKKVTAVADSFTAELKSRSKVEIHPAAISYDDEERDRARGRR